MDEGCNDAVAGLFVKLYEEGYIYRGNRIINWCVDCKRLCLMRKWIAMKIRMDIFGILSICSKT